MWTVFATRFTDLWRTTPTGDSYPAALFPAGTDTLHAERLRYLDEVFRDTTGFCAAEIVRRVIGFARPADFTTIEDAARRATCERGALRLARTLLLDDHHDIHDVIEAARRSRHHAGR